MPALGASSLLGDFYESGVYEEVLEGFKSEFGDSFSSFEHIIEFGEHRDDNFGPDDIRYALEHFSTREALLEEGSIGGIGHINRGWYSSTFNRFVLYFLSEIREVLCDDKKATQLSEASNVSATGMVAAFATWVGSKFDISDPAAIGIATAVLLTIVYATRGALCKMTDEEIKKSFDKKVPKSD